MENLTILDKDMNVILNKDDLVRIKITSNILTNLYYFSFRSPNNFTNFDQLKTIFLNQESITVKINNEEIKSGIMKFLITKEVFLKDDPTNYYQIDFVII